MPISMVMKVRVISTMVMMAASFLAGCKDKSASEGPESGKFPKPPVVRSDGQTSAPATQENIDAGEKAAAARLVPAEDPVWLVIKAARSKTRQAFNSCRFDELEAEAAELRASTDKTFANGSWKIGQFYESLGLDDDEADAMWIVHDGIYKDWIAAKPQSITARTAYIGYLTDSAWRARGSAYANKVTPQGWKLFGERLEAAEKIFEEARELEEKDPCLWWNTMSVALGQSWEPAAYDALLSEVRALAPGFWGCEVKRAHSLLPRWHGKEGDWEAFAEQTCARPEGVGIELYPRIVMYLRGYYENVFRETKASWPMTKDGLEVLLKKYPDSLSILSEAAMLATMAEDQPMAKDLFAKIGDLYLPSTFKKPERFEHFRHWAETGNW